MAGRKLLVNQSKAMPCFVHPGSDQLHAVSSGASSDWKLKRDRLVFFHNYMRSYATRSGIDCCDDRDSFTVSTGFSM